MKKTFFIILFIVPILIFGATNFGTRLLVYPSTFSVNMGVYLNDNPVIKSNVFVVWWLKVGFDIYYPEVIKNIFVMSDFSNDVMYSTYIPDKNVYVKGLGDFSSALDFFKKYVIQIIRNYYIYGQDKEEVPLTNVGYYVKTNKDSSLKEIDFKFGKNTIRFSFSNWNFDISDVMSKLYSFIDKNKIQMK